MAKLTLNEEYGEDVPETPEAPAAVPAVSEPVSASAEKDADSVLERNGLASLIGAAITDELKLIDGYNGIVSTVAGNSTDQHVPDEVKDAGKPISDIVRGIIDECNMHVGKLQQALTLVSDHADAIKDGMEDAEKVTRDAEAESDTGHKAAAASVSADADVKKE